MVGERHLFRQRSYWPIFATMFLGAFNDNIFKNALIILITYKSYRLWGLGPQEMVVFCAGVFVLPFFLFSAYAGILADKYSKSQLVYYLKWWEVGTMMLGAVGFYWELLPLLIFTLALMGTQSAFFGPAKYSILPELLPSHQLLLANGWMGMGTFVAILAGTVLGTQLISISDTLDSNNLHAGVVVIVVALLGTWTARQIPPLTAANHELFLGWRPIRPTRKILQITFQQPQIGPVVLAISWFWFLGSALLSLLPNYAKDVVGGSKDVVSLFLGLFSVGVGIGSLLCRRISNDRVELGVVPWSALGMSICLVALYLLGEFIPTPLSGELIGIGHFFQTIWGRPIVLTLLLFAICGGIYAIPLTTLIQQATPLGLRSQVVAGNNILNALAMVLASGLLMGFFALGRPLTEGFALLAGLNLAISIWFFWHVLLLLRSRERGRRWFLF